MFEFKFFKLKNYLNYTDEINVVYFTHYLKLIKEYFLT